MKDRALYRLKRAQLSVRQREEKSLAVCRAIINGQYYKNAGRIMCYSAIDTELDLQYLIDAALHDGKQVLLPAIQNSTMLARVYDGRLQKGAYNIYEPMGEIAVPDLVIAPMLAFNAQKYRVGYGAGYYDRYLREYDVPAIGAAFAVQRACFTPDEYDVPLVSIYTEQEIL